MIFRYPPPLTLRCAKRSLRPVRHPLRESLGQDPPSLVLTFDTEEAGTARYH